METATTDTPIIPAAPVPTPPTYPSTTLNIGMQGMTISTMLAPGLALTQGIDEATMNEIVGRWLETRRELKRHLDVVQK